MVLVARFLFFFCGQQVACKAPSFSTLLDGMKRGPGGGVPSRTLLHKQNAQWVHEYLTHVHTEEWEESWEDSHTHSRLRKLTETSNYYSGKLNLNNLYWCGDWGVYLIQFVIIPIVLDLFNIGCFCILVYISYSFKKNKTSFYCKWSINRCWPLTNEIMMMMMMMMWRKQRNCVSMQANISVEESSECTPNPSGTI